MYESMEAVHGREVADTVMAHLPPVGWADVATKQDLVYMREVLKLHTESTMHREMIRQTKWFVGTTVGALIAVSGLPQVLGANL